jgi:hypothetical protein
MPWGLESLPPSCPLAGRLMCVLGAIIEVPVLAVLDSRQSRPLGDAIAFQLVRHEPLWHGGQALEQLPEEFLCGLFVPATLH